MHLSCCSLGCGEVIVFSSCPRGRIVGFLHSSTNASSGSFPEAFGNLRFARMLRFTSLSPSSAPHLLLSSSNPLADLLPLLIRNSTLLILLHGCLRSLARGAWVAAFLIRTSSRLLGSAMAFRLDPSGKGFHQRASLFRRRACRSTPCSIEHNRHLTRKDQRAQPSTGKGFFWKIAWNDMP